MFEQTLQQVYEEQGGWVACLFTGTVNPKNGKNWCPDCERVKDQVEHDLIGKAKGKFIVCKVERSEWVGNYSHPFKASELLQVTGVPTALLIKDGEVKARAQSLKDFQNKDLLLKIAKGQ